MGDLTHPLGVESESERNVDSDEEGEMEGGIGLQVLLLYFNYLESWEDTRLLRREREKMNGADLTLLIIEVVYV